MLKLKVRKAGHVLVVTIPAKVADYLGIESGDILHLDLKKEDIKKKK